MTEIRHIAAMWRAASPTPFIPLPMCLSALGNCQSKKVKRKQHHTSPCASLCITVLGRGFIYFQGNRAWKSRLRQKVWRVAQQIAPKAKQEANRQHRDQIDLIKTKANVVLAPSQTPHPCCLYGVVRQPSKRILFVLCDHSAVFERSCVLEKGLCSNCTS